ncbi:MAG: flagellar hook-length control protein FliK [Thermosediminibacteraceae bacterium]|nr:flagellar hook-length control protein FliK [Thermosediminibacteraceae bacterium]
MISEMAAVLAAYANEITDVAAFGKKLKVDPRIGIICGEYGNFKQLLELLSVKPEEVSDLEKAKPKDVSDLENKNVDTDVYVLLLQQINFTSCNDSPELDARDIVTGEKGKKEELTKKVVLHLESSISKADEQEDNIQILNLGRKTPLEKIENLVSFNEDKEQVPKEKLELGFEKYFENQSGTGVKKEPLTEINKAEYEVLKTKTEVVNELIKNNNPVETFEIIVQTPTKDEVTANFKDLDLYEKGSVSTSKSSVEKIKVLKDAIFDEMVEKVQVAVKGQVKEMRIKLKPEHLGEIIVKITADKGEMSAEFFVKNAQIKEALQSSVAEIKSQIQQQGYEINEIKVYDFPLQFDMNQQSGRKFESDKLNSPLKRIIRETSEDKISENFKEVGEIALYSDFGGPNKINYVV